MHIKHLLLLLVLAAAGLGTRAAGRQKLNFNSGWLLRLGPAEGAEAPDYDDHAWQRVTLPRAWNEAEAFRRPIHQLSDTTIWYRKHFRLRAVAGRKFFVEFEGVRFGAEVYVNGHRLGLTENGVMASGWDLTPYVHEGENVIAVWVDSSWRYHERSSGSPYQWNDRNFNANYGGIPKNVWLHETDRLYQTLPLYSNLQTTGVYVYGTDYDIAGHAVTLHAESQVRNDDERPRSFTYRCEVADKDGRTVARFGGRRVTMQPGETCNVAAEGRLTGAHFWSWGYGYLYTVTTRLMDDDGMPMDDHVVRTGFRKTRFAEGRIWLNDRIIMMHGYAQRTSNEWPGVGMSVPAWLSDFSNRLQVESGGNLVRWMHVTPWKQDVESCDRVGLIQAMPAGDAEKDVTGRRWEQRVELMRDAIIYNRNNPSILFYEGGNESISPEHMAELRRLRDRYDPHGGRAIGSREMLDVDEAEYGGEMLYVNKSKGKPYWQMEYYRDEGLRKYWDDYKLPLPPRGRRAALPWRARARLQPQPGPAGLRHGGTLARLLRGPAGHGPAREQRRGEDCVFGHEHSLPRRGQLPHVGRYRRHAHSQGRVLRPPGDVERMGDARARRHPHHWTLELRTGHGEAGLRGFDRRRRGTARQRPQHRPRPTQP